MSFMIRMAESGHVPDSLMRFGMRRLLRHRLRDEKRRARHEILTDGPAIAVDTDMANKQHYELPPEFFRLMLGPRLKYSCCSWSSPGQTLEGAEEEMLALTCQRAGVEDGMKVLDLGSGWGSLGLWIAEKYPGCVVQTVSNSDPQQRFIAARARERELGNIETMRADVNEFDPGARYDRIVSVEMFEHVRDHAELLSRIVGWLQPGGKLFVHIFCHKDLCYPFEVEGEEDWMAKYFFTGGIMPSYDLLTRYDSDMKVVERWKVSGFDYEKTLLAWLDLLDSRREQAMEILQEHYGRENARVWFVRWRIFLLACAELFAYGDGWEWFVGHYLLEPVRSS